MSSPSSKSQKTPRTPVQILPTPAGEQKVLKRKREEVKKMEDRLQGLVNQRAAVFGKLNRVKNALKSSASDPNPNIRNIHYLQVQQKTVDNCYNDCNSIQNQIYELPLSEERINEETESYVEFESLHNDVAVWLGMLMDATLKTEVATVPPAMGPSNPAHLQPAIPVQPYVQPLQVPLPTFDGSYEKWYSFKAMFTTVMNRHEQEEPALKLFHLRNSLVGQAAGIIDEDLVNNNDYDAAWLMLTQRYEDKRVVVDKHVENLLNLPKINLENAINMRKMLDTCIKNVEALKHQDLPAKGLGEQMLVNLIAGKMDKKLRVAWEARQKKNVLSTYEAILEFLQEQCRIYEKLETNVKPSSESVKQKTMTRSHTLITSELKDERKCQLCKANHELWKCEAFKNKSVSEKYEVLIKCGACFNCLGRGHRTSSCSSSRSCRECGKKHHTSLHAVDIPNKVANNTSTKPPEISAEPIVQLDSNPTNRSQMESATTLCSTDVNSKKQILLSTAVILVHGFGNTPYLCRVLLDSASQMNFITERFANLLSLKLMPTDVTVSGLNGKMTRIYRMLRTKIKSCHGDFSIDLDVLVTPRITGDLPVKSFEISEWPLSSKNVLADPKFNKRGRVDMLIGAEYFWKLLEDGVLELGANLPTLRNTKFGWVAGGVIELNAPIIARTFCQVSDDESLVELLRSFYKVEACDEIRIMPKTNDDMCLRHFQQTHYRTEEERYVVQHPFNERKDELGDSREMALKRFLNLERKLYRQPELKEQYSQFIREYEQLGHMREIHEPIDEYPGSVYYLLHHCVLRPSSTTTKLRVVFDGSARTSTGVSINDILMTGPTIQNDLFAILLRFRGFQYVFTLDIPKMFRQVRIHPQDTKYQRIFWRYNENDPLTIRELQTVTYGLGSSPFQATMALKQVSIDHKDEFSEAAMVIDKGTYMDDILTGADTLSKACQLQRDVKDLLAKGCFSAHKWCANHPEIVRDVPEELRGNDFEVADDNPKIIVKTLGMTWNPMEDWFSVTVPDYDNSNDVTRRKLLSQLAKIFDPLGLFGPVITTAKLILREVGELQIDWDDPVPLTIGKKWRNFRNEMTILNEMKLPRWVSCKDVTRLELHGFADASDLAYGACLYVRTIQTNGSVQMKLICSKSRILPKKGTKMKAITTPRAELLAVLLLARLIDKLLDASELDFELVHLWSDSKIVLAWIKKSPHMLHTYVSNRVSEIQRLTSNCIWNYIPSHSNPADLLSRGEQPKLLVDSKMWWMGPLSFNCSNTVTIESTEITDDQLPELRAGIMLTITDSSKRMSIFDKVSSFNKIVRSVAYLVRFTMYIISKRKTVLKGLLTAEEMQKALLLIVRLVQRETFQQEILALTDGVNTKHRHNGLKAFLDPQDGILRVGGRIKRAFVPYDSRHQMLLPARHPITESLVRHMHLENLHIGQKGLLAIIRQRYWPLNVKTTIRKVIRNCITCFKANPLKTTQLMGDLPSYRIRPAPVFANTGVDYAGPFWVKSLSTTRKPQYTKAYVSLFVCMQTRAIHLELVSDLTTDAFLAALRRFISRRGCPRSIYSDNATNFVGAKTELHELWLLFQNQSATRKITSYCTNKGIDWSFIPPRSPHFGGIWEAGVKQVKYHLKRIVSDRRLTYEELYTTLTQIEAVLNSRPLAPSSDDPSDYTAITPAHFLVGREMQAVAEPSYLHLKENTLSRWQLVQTMLQHFWKRWTAEYLPELQNRSKWHKTNEINVGSLVLLVDQNAPPFQWPLGRIVAVHPGNDSVTRVVTVRIANGGEFKRAVTEVCLLPLDQKKV
ncbi:uncharacterized protein LOC131439115 [Malaya genurostris]|uniref:uncharacterized protein LOC131439115 n=1 Tax=Malaya genurostris TaxID=325434 RepID=UPI0026F39438|nr:uncharacterized protein LOC131439115 [Malaya genurostris]